MTPLAFSRHVAGYRRQEHNEIDRWRHMYAKLHNVNVEKAADLLDPLLVFPLPRDSEGGKKRTRKPVTHKKITQAHYDRLWAVGNPGMNPPEAT